MSVRRVVGCALFAILKPTLCAVLLATSLSAHSQQSSLNPSVGWADSYSRGGVCWIDSTFDHAVGNIGVATNEGLKTVRQVSAAQDLNRLARRSSDPIYNDVQCGHGPANDNGDEDQDQCPGRVDQGSAGCTTKGPLWNLETLFPGTNSATEAAATEAAATEAAAIEAAAVEAAAIEAAAVEAAAAEAAAEAESMQLATVLPTEACFTTGQTAKADFATQCGNVASDCDIVFIDNSSTQMCANYQLGLSAAPGVPTLDELGSVDTQPEPELQPSTIDTHNLTLDCNPPISQKTEK